MSPDAAQLLRRLRAADEDALRELFSALAPQAHALAQRIAGAAAANAILEEVLLLAWREPQRWSEQTFHAQLLRCVRDVAVLVRTREITAAAALARWRPPQIEPQSSALLDRADAAERVRAALFALGAERRELLEAAWFEGATLDQLAGRAAIGADETDRGRRGKGDEAAQMLTDALEQLADAIETRPMSADAELGPAILGLADPPDGAAQDPAAQRLAARRQASRWSRCRPTSTGSRPDWSTASSRGRANSARPGGAESCCDGASRFASALRWCWPPRSRSRRCSAGWRFARPTRSADARWP